MHNSTIHAIILLCFISTFVHGQNDYHNGYIIDNFGNKLSCHIENHGNPAVGENYFFCFEPKGELIQANVETIRELYYENVATFRRAYITVDVSKDQIYTLKDTAHHENLFSGHVLLLCLLEHEKVDLYKFYFEGEEYFFYRKDSSVVQNLIYKRFELLNNNKEVTQILQDFTFRDQLDKDLPCSANVKKVYYSKNDLLEYFHYYLKEQEKRQTVNTTPKVSRKEKKLSDTTKLVDEGSDLAAKTDKASFQLSASYSMNTTHFILRDGDMVSFYYEKKIMSGAGIECSYMFPYNRNNIGFFAGANYIHYYQENDLPPSIDLSLVNIKAVDVPIGVVAHHKPFDKFSLYIRLGLSNLFLLNNSYMSIYIPDNYLEMKNALGYFIGGGISYGRFSLDASYYQPKNLSKNSLSNASEYHQFSFRLSYTFISTGRK